MKVFAFDGDAHRHPEDAQEANELYELTAEQAEFITSPNRQKEFEIFSAVIAEGFLRNYTEITFCQHTNGEYILLRPHTDLIFSMERDSKRLLALIAKFNAFIQLRADEKNKTNKVKLSRDLINIWLDIQSIHATIDNHDDLHVIASKIGLNYPSLEDMRRAAFEVELA